MNGEGPPSPGVTSAMAGASVMRWHVLQMRDLYRSRRWIHSRSLWRVVLVTLVLVCFAGLQTASLVVDHPHEHGGPHSHCCPICHASHVPGMQAVAGVQLAAPAGVNRHSLREDIRIATVLLRSFNSSRAPRSEERR